MYIIAIKILFAQNCKCFYKNKVSVTQFEFLGIISIVFGRNNKLKEFFAPLRLYTLPDPSISSSNQRPTLAACWVLNYIKYDLQNLRLLPLQRTSIKPEKKFVKPELQMYTRISLILTIIILFSSAKIILLCLKLKISDKFFLLSSFLRNKSCFGGNNISKR